MGLTDVMTFNPTIDFGQVLVAVSVVVAAVGAHFTLKTRMDSLEKLLESFSDRMDTHENSITLVVGQVQRVVGRLEEADRRAGIERRSQRIQ